MKNVTQDRKKILILGHNDATQFIDIFNQYTRLFDKEKFEVTVAYLTGKPNEETRQRTIAERVLFLDIPKGNVRMLKIGAIRQLLALTRENNFQLVICHRYKPTYIMLWVNLFHRVPALVFVMHEIGTMHALGRQLLIAALARKNMLFAGVSNAVRDDMRRDLWCVPAERIITLYNMIDIELTEPQIETREAARQTLSLAADDFVFGNLARLDPNKDQTTLINAFAKIKPICPHAKLLIIGSGKLEASLKAHAQASGFANDIIFTGFIAGAFRYLKAFDCFVLSSIREAFGRVLIEAMVARLPIIATRVDGIPEVIGENGGTLIPAGDADALANAMQQIYALTPAKRVQRGETAYQHACDHFSIPCFQRDFWRLPLMSALKE